MHSTAACGFDWRAMLIGMVAVMPFLPFAFVLGRRSAAQDGFPDPFANPYGDDPGVHPHG